MIVHSFEVNSKEAEYKAYSDGFRTLLVVKRLAPNARIKQVKFSDLPKEAQKKISKRQRSYIDEFVFYKLADGSIEAWYAGSRLSLWNGKGWQE